MRPTYETDADLANEVQVKEILSHQWKVTFHKMPRSYNIDWLLVDKDGMAKAIL